MTGEGGACPELAEEPAPYSIRGGVRVNGLHRNEARRYPPMWYISTFSRGPVMAVLISE